ncbi:MAG: cytochrome c [Paracoccaceae bacterium]|nr:cytochrome c [Paracoccaceae bacterium]
MPFSKALSAILIVILVAYVGYSFTGSDTAQIPPEGAEPGAPLANVVVPPLSGAAKLGEVAFNNNCAACHGKNAAGQQGVAPPLVHQIYRPSHHGDIAFLMAAQNGVRSHHWTFGDMPPVKGVTRADVVNIVAYIRALQQANGIN